MDAGHRLITILAVAHDPGQSRDLGDPATVFFAFELDREGHARNLPSALGIPQVSLLWSPSPKWLRGTGRGTRWGNRPSREVFPVPALCLIGPTPAQSAWRYMHLSPAATKDAIRLLDGRDSGVALAENFGNILDMREVTE